MEFAGEGADDIEKFVRVEGFDEVLGDADVDGIEEVFFFAVGAEDNDGQGRGCFVEDTAHLQTAHPWHGNIGDDKIGLYLLCQGQPFLSVIRQFKPSKLVSNRITQKVSKIAFVFDK